MLFEQIKNAIINYFYVFFNIKLIIVYQITITFFYVYLVFKLIRGKEKKYK